MVRRLQCRSEYIFDFCQVNGTVLDRAFRANEQMIAQAQKNAPLRGADSFEGLLEKGIVILKPVYIGDV